MNRLLAVTVLLCFIAPASAVENSAPSFSNEDLEKYKSTGVKARQSQPPAEENKTKEEEREPTKYEVPYEPMAAGAKRIIISVTINNSLTVPMALDTGSTGMIISAPLAEKLGVFDKDEGKFFSTVTGIGGKELVIITIIDIVQVGKAKDDFIPTAVTPTSFEGQGFEGLVGMDFMSKYSVHVDSKKHVLVFEELPPQQNMRGGHDEEWWRSIFHQFASVRSDWKDLMNYLNRLQDDTEYIRKWRRLADRQYKEADKLMTKLHGYAVDNDVPMEWREY